VKTELVEQITKTYQDRCALFGKQKERICSSIEELKGEEKLFAMAIYAMLPLSDIADYDFELLKSYAVHGAFLYQNAAFCKGLTDEQFLNYVLCPRINTEDLTDCRPFFYEKVKDLVVEGDLPATIYALNSWCYEQATYHSTSERTASPMTVYKGGYGRCGEESTFLVTVLRSVGIACRQVYVPRWSHSDSNHAWVEILMDGKWVYIGACEPKPILNCGWFPYAASRAMLVHARCFGPFADASDDLFGREDAVTYVNASVNYTVQKNLSIKVLQADGKPAAGATVQLEIVNSAEWFPVATVFTDAAGEANCKLGLGSVRVYAFMAAESGADSVDAVANICGKVTFGSEKIVDVATEDSVELTLATDFRRDTESYELIAPISAGMTNVDLTEEEDKIQCDKNQEADKIRNARIESYLNPERIEAAEKYPQISRALTCSKGNVKAIEAFLRTGFDTRRKERVLSSLTQKDCRDVQLDVLVDAVKAYKYEKKWMNQLGDISHLQGGFFIDNESKQDAEDMTSEFYRAPMDFFTEYVASPRIFIEHLSPWRQEIAAFFGKKVPFATAEEIVAYVESHIQVINEEEYPALLTTPRGTLELGRGSALSIEVLIVALCRTCGIPARLDMTYRKAQYLENGEFVFARKTQNSFGTLVLSYEDAKLPEYYLDYTVAYRQADGEFLTINREEFFTYEGLSDQQEPTGEKDENSSLKSGRKLTLQLWPGQYRITTCNRMLSGNIKGKNIYFIVEAGKETVCHFSCKEDVSQLSKEQEAKLNEAQLTVYVDPGKEPTEHVLGELLELYRMGKAFAIPLQFIVTDETKMDDALLQKVLAELKVESDASAGANSVVLQKDDDAYLSDMTQAERSNYPHVRLHVGDETLFTASGYQVGIVDRFYRLTES